MRICAIVLPELRVEVLRAAASGIFGSGAEVLASGSLSSESGPVGIVVAAPPVTEAKLLGNTKLDVVSREARALGVSPGQTIAQARSRAPNLSVRVVRPEAVRRSLARLAEVALAFGATVAFSAEGDAKSAKDAAKGTDVSFGDIVWVDVTGCAHLHAPDQEEGERILASRLANVLVDLGHTCAIAIADGPRIAGIFARELAMSMHAGHREYRAEPARQGTTPIAVIPPGKNASAMEKLAITALPLPEDDIRWLSKIGVRTVSELRALPRASLATRLGTRAAAVLALSEGDDRAPLTPYIPPETPEEEVSLEYGVEGTEALVFVAKTLADRIATRLAGRAVAASRMELVLRLDAALLSARHFEKYAAKYEASYSNWSDTEGAPLGGDREPESERERGPGSTKGRGREQGEDHERDHDRDRAQDRDEIIVIELPAPLSSAHDLLVALRPKVERLVLRAPVLSAKLRVPVLVHKPQAALSLFEPVPKAERALPRLCAELVADLGPTAVGKLALGDAWAPEDRSRFVRVSEKTESGRKSDDGAVKSRARKRRHLLSSIPEPTRILAVPLPVARESVRVVRRLSRLEAVEWWKQMPGAKKSVDYVYAWVDEAPAWVEIDRSTGATCVKGWFD